MEAALTKLGLNPKESAFYVYLLEHGALTAAQLAKELNESRTNTYMVLERLDGQGLVVIDDKPATRTYSAADPAKLKNLLVQQQQQFQESQRALANVLPQLTSAFKLGNHRPGVTYFEGIAGFKIFQDNVSRSDPPIDVLASNVVAQNKEVWEALDIAVAKRMKLGKTARIIFHTDAKNWLDVQKFKDRGYEVAFWGDQELIGEIIIFGQNVGITAYEPALITTVISNDIIASTFSVLYDQLWAMAEKA